MFNEQVKRRGDDLCEQMAGSGIGGGNAFITDLAGEWACVVRCARTVDRVNNNIKHGTHGQWAKAEVPAGLSYGFHENAISAGFVWIFEGNRGTGDELRGHAEIRRLRFTVCQRQWKTEPSWQVLVGASDPPEPAGKDAVRTLNKFRGFARRLPFDYFSEIRLAGNRWGVDVPENGCCPYCKCTFLHSPYRPVRGSLLAVFFAFNQLPEISFRFGWALILAVLIALLNNVQNPFDGAAGSGVLANLELACYVVKEFCAHGRIIAALHAFQSSWWNNPATMVIGHRLRELREEKKLSQGDIEKSTGLLHCYISRVENGHTVPAIETLEKLARALETPMYQLFHDGDKPPKVPNLLRR
jgi:DNA-binding XRE family transcriptional regulator